MPEELWMEVRDLVQEAAIKTFPKKKQCEKVKSLSEEAFQIDVKEGKWKAKVNWKDIPI